MSANENFYEKQKRERLQKHDDIMKKMSLPDPKVPSEVADVVRPYGEFMDEMFEKPEVDTGFRNAIGEWERAWGIKGDAEHGNWNYYKDQLIYVGAKGEQEFQKNCVYPKEEGHLKVGDECYKKSFKVYKDYAKPFFADTVNAVAKNVSGKSPIYRFMDIKNAKKFVDDVQNGTKKDIGPYWSWDLDKHRNINSSRWREHAANKEGHEMAKQLKASYDIENELVNDAMKKWDFVFFRGRVADPSGVDFHASVSSNMGGLDHAEIRLKPDADIIIDTICISHEYKNGLDSIQKGNGDGCVKLHKPVWAKSGEAKKMVMW